MQKNEPSPEKEEPKIGWIQADQNPWKVKILDIRPLTQTIISTSEDPKMASNAVSYNGEDGSAFMNQTSKNEISFDTQISFQIDGKLEEGVIFPPTAMEHKWAIYFREDKLIFVRSWHREVLVIAETKQIDNQLIITKITGKFIEEEPQSMQEAILQYLIISHGMGEIAPAPLSTKFQENIEEAASIAFSHYGKMAHFIFFGDKFNYQPQSKLRSHSLLHIAVAMSNKQKIDLQLAKGSDIHGWAADGLTPLHWAIAASAETLTYLLEKGGNPNIESMQGATPLMNAVQSNQLEHFQILIDQGADINYKDHRGFTALHRAAERGREQMIKIMIEKGVDTQAEAQGHTAISLAKQANQLKIVNLLA